MPIDKKKVLVGAAVAGLIVGSSAAMAMGQAPERDASAKTESADKHGCGAAHGCGGKNGCPAKS